uniref:Uncharacterized protein n=1 Tax=Cyprinodon variegatus TaxID=28743 RepID=A0A3Q2GR00_CYPVA
MHVPVRRLLLPVQRLLQDKLCKLISVRLSLNIQVKVVVGCDIISAQRVGPDVRVESALQRKPGARSCAFRDLYRDVCLREAWWIVVYWVFQKHLHIKLAAGTLLADLLPVNFLVNEKDAVLQIDLQVWRPRAGYNLEAPRGHFGEVNPQVFGDVPHQGAMLCLLRDGVADLRERSISKGPIFVPALNYPMFN